MARKFFTRADVQTILESNALKCKVSYIDREDTTNDDNYIVYYPSFPLSQVVADDRRHMRKISVTVVHFHKKKLDSIDELISEHFITSQSVGSNIKQPETDYLADYYTFECFTGGKW